MRPSSMQMSRTSPSTPLAGSWIAAADDPKPRWALTVRAWISRRSAASSAGERPRPLEVRRGGAKRQRDVVHPIRGPALVDAGDAGIDRNAGRKLSLARARSNHCGSQARQHSQRRACPPAGRLAGAPPDIGRSPFRPYHGAPDRNAGIPGEVNREGVAGLPGENGFPAELDCRLLSGSPRPRGLARSALGPMRSGLRLGEDLRASAVGSASCTSTAYRALISFSAMTPAAWAVLVVSF